MISSGLFDGGSSPEAAARIDSHQHFWKYDPEQYPWMTESMRVLRRDYLPGDLKPLLDRARFRGSIAVQARQTVEETDWLLQLAQAHDQIRGVVGWLDLRSPDLGKQLAGVRGRPKLVGLRHVLQDEADDAFMLRPDFIRGIAQLQQHGLCYDLLVFPRHLPAAAQLVGRFPEQRFVLDHLGKPAIAQGRISPWREDLRRLADHPNVSCKLSGMVTEAGWGHWQEQDFRPYLDTALECFGAARLMIGSDWPVCTLSGDYQSTLGVVLRYAEQFSESERAGILGGNCARFYRLAGF